MMLSEHIIIGGIVGMVLIFTVNPDFALLFFIASFATDIDHYIWWLFKADMPVKKKINPLNCEKWFDEHKGIEFIFPLHTKEVMILMIIVVILFPNAYTIPIMLGYSLHILLDIISDKIRCERVRDMSLYKVIKRRSICIG